ncbi:MAG TPA: transposase [Salinivirga sp.]|uniref:REP-associated tyrosine transposase n=1 Tax=Salinivirga sp. TaxID=1970192 RepID=UPI002B467BE4|nr:transposase [Salinivirga sp.]HKK59743.1 transposase [Salinivirga sp.]
MSRKYRFYNPEGIYFVSFATVYWLDVFVRQNYFSTMAESLEYCRKEKGLLLFAYCILPSHVHLIFKDKNNDPGNLLKEIKTFTSKQLQAQIKENPRESRKEWLLWFMQRAGKKNSNVKKSQFWQQNNKPIELWSRKVIEQKIAYIHNNPVESGFVTKPEQWKYSSASNYAKMEEAIEIDKINERLYIK